MALNWVQLDPAQGRRPLMLPGVFPLFLISFNAESFSIGSGERTLETLSDTSLHLEVPPTLAGPKQEIKVNANMWLTNQRVSRLVLLSSEVLSSIRKIDSTAFGWNFTTDRPGSARL
jgi:hypothetical protein